MVAGGEASEPWRRAQPQGCGGQSGEIPAQRISADQRSPAREACLLTRRGGRGWELRLGLRRSDLRERTGVGGVNTACRGLVRHSLLGEGPGKCLDLPKRQETIVSGYVRRWDAEHRLNELQRRPRATATSADPRDGHETLRLLLPPPRSLCASTGHSPHCPSR